MSQSNCALRPRQQANYCKSANFYVNICYYAELRTIIGFDFNYLLIIIFCVQSQTGLRWTDMCSAYQGFRQA